MNLPKSSLIILLLFLFSCNAAKKVNPTFSLNPEITITEIQAAYKTGEYNIAQVTQFYIDQINSLSKNGPTLNAVLTINPDALHIANDLDQELLEGKLRGPLHGIPILLKDNIDTQDKMPCTAGAIPMKNSFPLKDSPLAAQLRKAGAVILGKANMSEWANFHSSYSSSGWSALGGQCKNPYQLDRNPCGSSAGSGVAVSANLTVLAIGTETNGSIVCPATANGIVGIKPTVGLISRAGIIPISHTQDTGGPMARNVRDATLCLGALTAIDPTDPATLQPGRKALTDYTSYLQKDGLKGKRLGFLKSALDDHVRLTAVMQSAISQMEKAGATIIELDELLPSGTESNSFQVLLYEFKDGLNKYFTALGPDRPVSSLEDLISQTKADSIEMQYHDHGLLDLAQSKGDLTAKEYTDALTSMLKQSREEGIDKVMAQHNLDAIFAPTGSPAWKTDLTNGDNYNIYSSSPAAISGYPNITVPMGQLDGLPVGISFFGMPWTEGTLIEIAYSYEQLSHQRMTPSFLKGN